MKICILSCFADLLLKDTGASIRIYQLAKSLASIGHEVHVIIPNDGIIKDQYVDGIKIHCIRGFCSKAVLNICSKFLGISRPTSILFYDLLFIIRASRIIRESDVTQIEQQPAGGLLIPLIKTIMKKPLVVDCHDVFQALRIEHTSGLRKILETFLEKIAYKYADIVLTVSEKERKVLTSYGIRHQNIQVIPNGVDTEAFNNLLDIAHVQDRYELRKSRTVVFVGNMEYLPNQEAVHVIASEIAPEVQNEISNAKFLIVGRNPKEMKLPNLTFTGVVENVSELLASSEVAIAPLFHGSGTRLKILEYFSCSLPTVSTTVGVEGLAAKNEVHVLIEDDIEEFAIKVTRLLKDKTLAMRLGKAARKFVIDNYDWRNIARRLSRIYNSWQPTSVASLDEHDKS